MQIKWDDLDNLNNEGSNDNSNCFIAFTTS